MEAELKRRGSDVQTFVGMCTWNPFFQETLQAVEKSGVGRLVILPLFPQFSVTTTGSGFNLLRGLIEKNPKLKSMDTRWIRSWQDHPLYIEAFAVFIQRELAKFSNPSGVLLLFSAHSIPETYVKEGDPYLEQTKQTVEKIMDKLEAQNPYQLSFQSKIGPVKWLEPFTNDVIIDFGKRGVHDVLVVPISFVSEHIETLYELDIPLQACCGRRRCKKLSPRPCLEFRSGKFIQALAEIVESASL